MTEERDDDPTDTSHPLYDPKRDPTHQSYEGDSEDGVSKPDPAEDTYKVGPGFPPKQYTWKKGGPTPNPKGRPRKAPSMKPDVKKAFEDAIFDKVEVKKGDKKVWISKINLGLQQLATQFAKGDRHARRDVFQYAAQLGVDLQAKEIIEEVLGVNEQAIVDAAFRRRAEQTAPEGAPDDHVKAPPDLLDDDVMKSEPNEKNSTSAQPDTSIETPVEPVLDEHGNPLPVSDVRYIREIARRKLAQQKKNQGGS